MERNTRSRNDQQTMPITLGAAARRILRQKFIVILCVIVFAAVGATAGLLLPDRYEAKAVINVVQPSTGTSLRAALNSVDMDTEEAIAGSRVVLQAAADELGMEVSDLKATLDVAGHSNSTILDIIITTDSPEAAATMANTVAKAYLEHREGTLESGLDEMREKVDSVADDMTDQVVDQAVLSLITTSTDSGTLISEAQPPAEASSFGIAQTTFVGAAAGLLLGIFFAYIADRTSRNLGYSERLSEISGAPVSVIVPGDEEESAHQLLRRIGAPEGDLRKAGLTGITVFSPTPRTAHALAETLRGVLAENTTVMDAATFTALAPGKVSAQVKQSSPVLIDTAASSSTAKVLLAADATRVLLVPFSAKSTVKSATRVFDELTPSADTQVIPVYFSSTNL